jgi:hypothetical protein
MSWRELWDKSHFQNHFTKTVAFDIDIFCIKKTTLQLVLKTVGKVRDTLVFKIESFLFQK